MEAKWQLVIVLLALVLLIVLGAVGYKIFSDDGMTWVDAFYHTVLTISSVGYTDTGFGTTQLQKFYGFIFMSFCLVGLAITAAAFVSFFVQSKIYRIFWGLLMTTKMMFKREHHVIFGVNNVAPHIIREFYNTQTPFCIVTLNEEDVSNLMTKYKGLIIFHHQKRYFDDDIFKLVKIKDACTAILDLGNDETNHITADLIKQKNPGIKLLSVSEELALAPIMQQRINHVVNPHFMCGMRITSLAKRPSVVTHLDRMLYKKDGVYRIEEVTIKENSTLIGKSLGEIDFPKNLRLVVTEIMILKEKEYESNFLPLPEDIVREGMIIIAQGRVEDIETLRDLADGQKTLEVLLKEKNNAK